MMNKVGQVPRGKKKVYYDGKKEFARYEIMIFEKGK